MVNEEYRPTDREERVLEVLKREGRVNPLLVRRETGLGKGDVNTALSNLRAAGWVSRRVRGLYDLVEDPRERGDEGRADPQADTDTEHTESAAFTPEAVLGLAYDRELTDTRAEVLIEFVEWVASRDEGITKSDFEEEFWTEESANRTGYNAGSFWEAFAKAAMRQLEDFDKPNARTYRYIGNK